MTRSDEKMKKFLAVATAAKYSKTPVALGCVLYFPRSMLEIAKVSVFGCKKHNTTVGSTGYIDVPDAENVYREAEGRHMLAEAIGGPVNAQDGDLLHKAQKAWNALADLEVFLYQQEKNK